MLINLSEPVGMVPFVVDADVDPSKVKRSLSTVGIFFHSSLSLANSLSGLLQQASSDGINGVLQFAVRSDEPGDFLERMDDG